MYRCGKGTRSTFTLRMSPLSLSMKRSDSTLKSVVLSIRSASTELLSSWLSDSVALYGSATLGIGYIKSVLGVLLVVEVARRRIDVDEQHRLDGLVRLVQLSVD